MPIPVIDDCPLVRNRTNITFRLGDTSNSKTLKGLKAGSVSSLHALEHVGLGHYGDTIDIDGWRYRLESLSGLLEPGALHCVSVPTGAKQCVEFDARRLFRLQSLRDELALRDEILELALVDYHGNLHHRYDPDCRLGEETFGMRYGLRVRPVLSSAWLRKA